jgi:hypothetical protein
MKPTNINITITPCSRPSTRDTFNISPGRDRPSSSGCQQTASSGRSASPHRRDIHAQQPSADSSHSPSQSSSTSSLDDAYDYISRRESGRHVRGLTPSVIATVDAVLGPLHEIDLHSNHHEVNHGDDADGEDSEPKRSTQQLKQQHRHIHYADCSSSSPPPHSDQLKGQMSILQFRAKDYAQRPGFSPKGNKSNRVIPHEVPPVLAHQDKVVNAGYKTEVLDERIDSVDSQGSRGTDGGHFYTYEQPPVVPVLYQREFYERQLDPKNGGRDRPYQLQMPLGEDQQLEMYRTRSFMSEQSLEQQDGSGKQPGGADDFNQTLVFREDPELEKEVVRKLDRNLLPLLGILYLFSYLDRVNIGNARLFGLEEAVHLTAGQYNMYVTTVAITALQSRVLCLY